MDWFRFYSETVRDPKIRRVARKTQQSTAQVIGVWSILLSMASESQERGVLLLGNNPVTLDDIEDATGCNVSETLQEMMSVGMLDFDGQAYSISAWNKRQYESDNSTPRVQKHRQNKKQDVTLQKRFRNAPDTETDTETDTDTDTETEEERAATVPDDVVDRLKSQYENILGMMPPAIFPDARTYMMRLSEREASDWWILALKETVANADRPGWHYMKAVLESWLAAGSPTQKEKRTNGKPYTGIRRDPKDPGSREPTAAERADFERAMAAIGQTAAA